MKFEYKKFFLENPQLPDHRSPNQTSLWHIADSENVFDRNIKKYPTSPHLLNYLKNPITYSYNSSGFRTSDDFNLNGEGNVFLGCSHTFGIGHYLENVWSYKLHQKIGGNFYNISEPGCGIMTQYRYLNHFKTKIKFKNLFHFLPDECWGRIEFINHELQFHNVNHTDIIGTKCGFLVDNVQQHMFNYIYIDLIRNICKELGVNYYLVTKTYLDIDNINPHHSSLTPARDLMHYYVEQQDDLSDLFYFKYKNGITDNTDNKFLLDDIDPRTSKII
jgi:hypothetical protein